MKRASFSPFAVPAIFVGVILTPGCGQKEVTLAPVTGKVTVDGKPLTSGSVSLIPDVPLGSEGAKQASKIPTLGPSGGEIGPDGTYKIYTSGKEGAPLGKYRVRVVPPITEVKDDKEVPDIGFDKKYTDANKTPLRIEVVPNPQPGAYDLKLTK